MNCVNIRTLYRKGKENKEANTKHSIRQPHSTVVTSRRLRQASPPFVASDEVDDIRTKRHA